MGGGVPVKATEAPKLPLSDTTNFVILHMLECRDCGENSVWRMGAKGEEDAHNWRHEHKEETGHRDYWHHSAARSAVTFPLLGSN